MKEDGSATGETEVFARLLAITGWSKADSKEEVTPTLYEDAVPWIDGEGTWDWGGDTDNEWGGFSAISRFMWSSMGGKTGNGSPKGRSDKKPGGAARICVVGTTGSIIFKKSEDISSMGTCMDGAIGFEGSTMSGKTGGVSCIN